MRKRKGWGKERKERAKKQDLVRLYEGLWEIEHNERRAGCCDATDTEHNAQQQQLHVAFHGDVTTMCQWNAIGMHRSSQIVNVEHRSR